MAVLRLGVLLAGVVLLLGGPAVGATIRPLTPAPYSIYLGGCGCLPWANGDLSDGDFEMVVDVGSGAKAAVSLVERETFVELSGWASSVWPEGDYDRSAFADIGTQETSGDYRLILDPGEGEAIGQVVDGFIYLATAWASSGLQPLAGALGELQILGGGETFSLSETLLDGFFTGVQVLPVQVPIGTPFALSLGLQNYCCLDGDGRFTSLDAHFRFSLTANPPSVPPILPESRTGLLVLGALGALAVVRRWRDGQERSSSV